VRRHVTILAAVGLLTFFLGLGRAAVSDSDEAFYAEAAREMVESGNWLTPYYNYEPRFQKPILYYWLAAGTFQIAGVSAWAARFPSALSGLGLALLTYACGRRWFSPRVGLIAGLIVATNFGYFIIGRLALPDLLLTFFIALATWALLEVCRAGEPGAAAPGRPTRRWLAVAGVAGGLAVLTKGPVGAALPALVLAGALLMQHGWRAWRWRLPVGRGDVLLAAALFVITAAPWYVAMLGEHGTAYLDRFFIGENVDRFTTDRYNDPRPLGYYLPIVFGGLLPWSPFMLLWVAAAYRRWRAGARLWTPTHTRLTVWAVLPLVFYSVSVGQQPRYVLPILPPLAVLLAASMNWRIERAADAGRTADRAIAACATLGALVLVTLGILLGRGRPLLFALEPRWGLVAMAVILGSGLAVAGVAWRGRARQIVGTMAAASIATLLAAHFSIYSAAGLEPVQRMADLVAAQRPAAEPIGTHRAMVRNLGFYTGSKIWDLTAEGDVAAFLTRPERVLLVVRDEHLAAIEARHGVRARTLGAVRYINPTGLRLRSLLWPDPERDLDTVVLATNR
jgi:4-amino-4-deoxy-L-arabinose transferase-like glycosyltransferase